MTTLRICAEAEELRSRAAARPRKIREMEVLFMSQRPPARIFLLSFTAYGRHFFGLAIRWIQSARTTPSRKVRASGDQSRAAFVCEIRPCPLDEDQYSIAKAD